MCFYTINKYIVTTCYRSGRANADKAYRGPPKKWEEVTFLGRGGTGDVWLCQDTDANYQLVCKKIVAKGVSATVISVVE